MENRKIMPLPGYFRILFALLFLTAIAGAAFTLGLAWSTSARAADAPPKAGKSAKARAPRVVYPKKTELDFEGIQIEGELRNPGEFYFQHRDEEKFDSLVKRRKNFHREMLRDVVLGK